MKGSTVAAPNNGGSFSAPPMCVLFIQPQGPAAIRGALCTCTCTPTCSLLELCILTGAFGENSRRNEEKDDATGGSNTRQNRLRRQKRVKSVLTQEWGGGVMRGGGPLSFRRPQA